jgi:hypothetical protein
MSRPLEPQYPSAPGTGAVPGTNVMAILALVFAFVFAPLGIVFGHIAKRQIRRTGEGGSGLATAGLVLGYIFTILFVVSWIAIFVLAANSGTTTS